MEFARLVSAMSESAYINRPKHPLSRIPFFGSQASPREAARYDPIGYICCVSAYSARLISYAIPSVKLFFSCPYPAHNRCRWKTLTSPTLSATPHHATGPWLDNYRRQAVGPRVSISLEPAASFLRDRAPPASR